MKNLILEYVRDNPGATFYELCRDVSGTKGQSEMCYPDHKLFVWAGMSLLAIRAIRDLVDENRIQLNVVSAIEYSCAAEIPTLPPITDKRNIGIKEYWIPLTLSHT